MIIRYCDKCGRRVSEQDLAGGKAREFDEGKALCPACVGAATSASGSTGSVPRMTPAVPTETIQKPPSSANKRQSGTVRLPTPSIIPVDKPTSRKSSGTRLPAVPTPAAPPPSRVSSTHMQATSGHGPLQPVKSKNGMWIGIGVAAFALAGILIFVVGGSGAKPAAKAETKKPGSPTPSQPSTPAKTGDGKVANAQPAPTKNTDDDGGNPREILAFSLLEQAKAFFKANPYSRDEYQARLQKLVEEHRATPAGEQAVKLLAELPNLPPPPEPVRDPSLPDAAAWTNAIHLLKLNIDVAKDAVDGEWARGEDGGVVSNDRGHTRLPLPYEPPEEYDYRMVFTSTQGIDTYQILVKNGRPFMLMLGPWGNTVAGFEMVDNNRADANKTTVRRQRILSQMRRHESILRVRNNGVKAYLDGQLLIDFQTDYNNVGTAGHTAFPDDKKLWLGLSSWGNIVRFHSADVIEVTGKGKYPRGGEAAVATNNPTNPTPPNPVAPPATHPTNPAAPIVAKSSDPRQLHVRALNESLKLAGADQFAKAVKQMESAAADSTLASVKEVKDLAVQDAHALAWIEETWKAVGAGAALLKDGRAFTFERPGDKPLAVGKGTKNRVVEVRDDNLEVEQEVGGGGRVTRPVRISELSLLNRIELARMGLGGEAPAKVKLVAAGLALLRKDPTGGGMISLKTLRRLLDEAAKGNAPAEGVARMRAWADLIEKEQPAETLFAKYEQAMKQRNFPDARTALAKFRSDAPGSVIFDEHKEKLDAYKADIDTQEMESKRNSMNPGLYAAFFKHTQDWNNGFKELQGTGAVLSLERNDGDNAPMQGVNNDYTMRLGGSLLIETEGAHTFQLVHVDDSIRLWIDGKQILDRAGVLNTNDPPVTGSLTLTRGFHDIRVDFMDSGGGASFTLKWQPPGAAAPAEISPKLLFHVPALADKYQKG